MLWVAGVDLLDGTPIYDIKPYIPLTDCHPEASEGYTRETKIHELKVEFPEELLNQYPEEKRQAVLGILSQDPALPISRIRSGCTACHLRDLM